MSVVEFKIPILTLKCADSRLNKKRDISHLMDFMEWLNEYPFINLLINTVSWCHDPTFSHQSSTATRYPFRSFQSPNQHLPGIKPSSHFPGIRLDFSRPLKEMYKVKMGVAYGTWFDSWILVEFVKMKIIYTILQCRSVRTCKICWSNNRWRPVYSSISQILKSFRELKPYVILRFIHRVLIKC